MCASLKGGMCLRFYTKAPNAFALKCAPRFYQHCCYVQICCFFMLPIFAVSLGCIVMVHFKIHQNNLLKCTKLKYLLAAPANRFFKLKYLLAGAASCLSRLCKRI